jgi:predicted carbohydrate-binding protein with CBM5 and CBM33 domain
MSIAEAVGLRSKRRRLAAIFAFVAAAALAVGMATVYTQSKAEAHGASVFPGSRQYFCYFDALTPQGSLQPYNSACQQAVNQSGTTPLYNWFGNLDPNGQGRTVGYVPDGRICDGGGRGPYDFSPYNAAHANWPKTHLTSGSTIQWRYNNWAHHPGRFDLYITKPGWNPNQPIGWNDLELFTTVNNPPQNGGPGTDGGYYYANVTLPQRSGYHIIFTHWVRSDSPENFYACSDVVFDGGNGQVTGVRPGANLPGNNGDIIPPTDPTTGPTTGGPGGGDCSATASVNSWGSGATVQVTVTNTGSTTISDWMIHWLWPPNSGVTVSQIWNAQLSTMGDMEMASPVGWNQTIQPGQTASFGFNVNGSLSSMPAMDCII